ncbi:MAG TPA: mechanosensitive ion channel domain-containing protein [Gemmatimonadales bacterium]|nr:mechanosensitive ion channel domain-containing protein [Gemmatimonadales bacterium]
MLLQAAFELVGPNRAVQIFGVKLVGVTAENGRKLLLSLAVVLALTLIIRGLERLARAVLPGERHVHTRFWWRQTIRLVAAALGLLLLLSVWFDDPRRLTTAAGLVTAGLAIALQRVVTAFAAYFIILRGRLFQVGDRIVMGGVRGDVIGLGFLRTTIMEMGQPPPVQKDEPAIWVEARQYSGRIVTVTNDRIFEEPVYNYTRDFPYLWEELRLPVPYTADRATAERVLLEAARRHTVQLSELSAEALQELRRRYYLDSADLDPRVYWRLTDNWLELSVRFVTRERGVRAVKDAISREVLAGLEAAGIPVASATFEVTGLPTVRVTGSVASTRRDHEGG